MQSTREYIQSLVRQIIENETKTLIEGIDVNQKNKTVSFNPNHEENVDTSIILNPTEYYVGDIPVISLFRRKVSEYSGMDGNPLIYSLKGIKGWKFENPQQDITNLLRQFIRITEKINPVYNTIITVPSSNELNINFLHRLNKIIRANSNITDYFSKFMAYDVLESYVDWQRLEDDYGVDKMPELTKRINNYFYQMDTENNGYFSYKYFKDIKLRKYITRAMYSLTEKDLIYSDDINDKNILILDDTIASGQSVSETSKIIMETFTPKSVTIITLFSKI